MESVLVLTISGADRLGLVEQLAEVIAECGGNWELSRMAHLNGRFVGLLTVSVPGENQQELEVALRSIMDLDVLIASGERAFPEKRIHFDLHLLGADHPGIVRDVFKALAAVDVNVEELSTKTLSAADSGLLLFEADARLSARIGTDTGAVKAILEQIAQDIMVDLEVLT